MKVSGEKYDVYIVTNARKTSIYIGVTNDLQQRLIEHFLGSGGNSFTGKYKCYLLVYYESFRYITEAIVWEKELKKWSRKKKDDLISSMNPHWQSLNSELFDKWPPENMIHRKDWT
jgi:putative endonuclease